MANFTYTYSTLRQTIQDWLENDATEFTDKLDEIIGQAQIRIARECDLDIFRNVATLTTSNGTQLLNKPSDYIIDRSFYIVDGTGKFNEVKRKDTSFIYKYWPDPTIKTLPKYFNDYNDTQFILAPTPDAAYTIKLEYIIRVADLSQSNTTNWFSTKAPDALLYACLLGAAQFNKSEAPDIAGWEKEYQLAMGRLTKEEMGRKRRTDNRFGEPRGTL